MNERTPPKQNGHHTTQNVTRRVQIQIKYWYKTQFNELHHVSK